MEKKKEIEKVAYEIYERNGCVCGRDFDHWVEAETIVLARSEPDKTVKKKAVRKSPDKTPKAAKTPRTVKTAPKTAASGKGLSVGRPKKSID